MEMTEYREQMTHRKNTNRDSEIQRDSNARTQNSGWQSVLDATGAVPAQTLSFALMRLALSFLAPHFGATIHFKAHAMAPGGEHAPLVALGLFTQFPPRSLSCGTAPVVAVTCGMRKNEKMGTAKNQCLAHRDGRNPCHVCQICFVHTHTHRVSRSLFRSLTHSISLFHTYHRAHMERARTMIQLAHAAQRLNLCISFVIRGSVCLNAGAWSVRCLMGSAASVQASLGTRVGKTHTQPFKIWPSGALKIQDSHLFRGCPRCRGHNPCGGTGQRTSCSCGW